MSNGSPQGTRGKEKEKDAKCSCSLNQPCFAACFRRVDRKVELDPAAVTACCYECARFCAKLNRHAVGHTASRRGYHEVFGMLKVEGGKEKIERGATLDRGVDMLAGVLNE
jgi:hypothetical protein